MKIGRGRLLSVLASVVILQTLLLTQVALGVSNALPASPSSSPAPGTKASNPISHIVIIMQENHAFDNFFGAYPGLLPAYSVLGPDVKCNPYVQSNPTNCVMPYNGDSQSSTIQDQDMSHSWSTSHAALDGGKLDAFVSSQYKKYGTNAKYSMAYYTGVTLPDYWDYASYFSLNANFFSSELSYSYPNHLYLVAAQSGGCEQCNPSNDLTFPTIVSELQEYGVSWNYFAGNWKDSKDCAPISSGGVGYLNVLPDFPSIQLNSATCKNIENLNDLYSDINAGNLPDVSWVTPLASNSDHPGTAATLPTGQEYISKIVDEIESHPALWASTAIFLSWDDFGGYYDHVLPDSADTYGFGFRAPLIVISPYAEQGVIQYGPTTGGYGPTHQEDFSGFLSTIEAQWNLPSLTSRDAGETTLFYMLNFAQKPLAPLFLPTNQLGDWPLSSCPTKLCNSTGLMQPLVLQPFNMSNEQDSPD